QYFILDKLFRHVADHVLFFGKIFRREDVVTGDFFDQETAAVLQRAKFLRHLLSSFSMRSKIPAAPIPPPTHMVTMPYRALRRCISWSSVAVNFEPVQPSGWPSAIAPPFTFTLDRSKPSSRITDRACTANASLSSMRSIFSNFRPA